MRTLIQTVLAALLMTAALAAPAIAASESTHEVPEWMNRVCATKDSVNCYDTRQHAFVREMPGRTHMVCVFYADHPRRDYCS